MAPIGVREAFNSTTEAPQMSHGWVEPPNLRGTWDIIQSCTVTVLLSSWSVMALNLPRQNRSRWHKLGAKMRWIGFGLFFPEAITAMAAEQWESAHQSVKDFDALGHKAWTLRHAFFADMGGFILESPNYKPFVIDAEQLHYLVANNFLDYPDITVRDIWDRNKADGFARTITGLQIGWFCLQCIGRAGQHLPLTTLELSTVAYSFCTILTFIVWLQKPLDVEVPIRLHMETPIADVLTFAGHSPDQAYKSTPLDFVKSEPATSTVSPMFFALDSLFKYRSRSSKTTPKTTIANSSISPPRGLSHTKVLIEALLGVTYTGMHLAAWNFTFPTPVERTLWRVAAAALNGVFIIYVLLLVAEPKIVPRFGRWFLGKETKTTLDFCRALPFWVQVILYMGSIGVYTTTRLCMLVQSYVSLRSLPVAAYTKVDWAQYVPHV